MVNPEDIHRLAAADHQNVKNTVAAMNVEEKMDAVGDGDDSDQQGEDKEDE